MRKNVVGGTKAHKQQLGLLTSSDGESLVFRQTGE